MKLIDRLTQQSLQAEELLHLDAIVPERYVLEQDEQIQSVMIPKFSFLFADSGTIRLNSSKTLHTYIPDITLTITESIKYISELVKACCLEASFQSLPNPLVPNSVFNAETKLKPLEKMLQDLNIEQNLINQIIIRYSTSNLTKAFIEELKKLKENDNPINLILHFFLLADKMKPISCDKKTLSKLTGLSERMIDEKRRTGNIPYIQLSGTTDEKGGRKSIVFDPFEVMQYLNRNKKNVEIPSSN